jgi:squalene-associated FAD-dependent desaturase
VFEARPTLGGRANTFRDPVTEERIDNGQHVLAGCYTETLRFLRRIGSLHLLHWPSSLRVPMIGENGHTSELVLPPVPAPLNVAAGVLAWDALTGADRWSMLRIAGAIRGRTPVDPGVTVHEWLHQHGQSERLCRWLWEPLALAALNQSIDHAAAASFVAVTSRMFDGDSDASTLLVPAVPLDELYVAPAASYLAARGAALMAAAKMRVICDRDRVTAVTNGRELIPARVVVCAVPWFALSGVLETGQESLNGLKSNAAAMQSSPIVTVNVWLHEYEAEHRFVGLPGRTFQWVFARKQLIERAQSHLSLVSSGAEAICHAPNNELVDLALRELREAMPELRRRRVRHALVVRERHATFSLRPGGPPRPPTSTPIRGLFLAGDWIDTGLPATIESAVVSGHQAAHAVLAWLP